MRARVPVVRARHPVQQIRLLKETNKGQNLAKQQQNNRFTQLTKVYKSYKIMADCPQLQTLSDYFNYLIIL